MAANMSLRIEHSLSQSIKVLRKHIDRPAKRTFERR